MKLVDQVKDIHKFDREMVSEGKVFEHKYRNITENVIQISQSKSEKPEMEM